MQRYDNRRVVIVLCRSFNVYFSPTKPIFILLTVRNKSRSSFNIILNIQNLLNSNVLKFNYTKLFCFVLKVRITRESTDWGRR